MPRFNPAYFAILQKLRERKRGEARAVSAKTGKLRRRKDALSVRVRAEDPDPFEQHPAPKIRLPAGLVPPEIIRPDKHRGQGHYQALDNPRPKIKRRRVKPIMVSAVRDFRSDPLPIITEPCDHETAWSEEQLIF